MSVFARRHFQPFHNAPPHASHVSSADRRNNRIFMRARDAVSGRAIADAHNSTPTSSLAGISLMPVFSSTTGGNPCMACDPRQNVKSRVSSLHFLRRKSLRSSPVRTNLFQKMLKVEICAYHTHMCTIVNNTAAAAVFSTTTNMLFFKHSAPKCSVALQPHPTRLLKEDRSRRY